MVHHIVMWKFKPEIAEGEKAGLQEAMAQHLEALVGKVPGLFRRVCEGAAAFEHA